MLCSQCNVSNTGDSRFCKNCGTTLSVLASSSEVCYQNDILPEVSSPEAKKAENLIGQVIDNRYRLESLIAIGGMGAVFSAKRLSIGDEVAVKILHDFFSGDDAASDRFQREGQMAARLKHPNAVNIYDFGTTNNNLKYLVMELVEGQSLREILIKQNHLPLPLIADITNQVCAALDEAHRLGIIHRDIKPDNIIIHSMPNGLRIKVLDFGIAKFRDNTLASSLTQTGSIVGTPHYMSPEQCLGEEVDHRSDIYSMGIVIYQMLCGRIPFNATVATAVVVQHVNQTPPSPRLFNPNISDAVEAVVYQALEKRRDARQVTAGLLAQQLNVAIQAANQPPSYQSGSQSLSPPFPSWSGNFSASGFVSDGFNSFRQEMPAMIYTGDTPTVHLSAPGEKNYPSGATALNSETFKDGEQGRQPVKNKSKLILPRIAALLILPLLVGGGILMFWSGERGNNPSDDKTTDQKSEAAEKKSEPKPTPPEGMAFVPGGEFMLGRDDGKLEDERPAHKVLVAPFFMDVFEVTNEKYAEFVAATNRKPPDEWKKGNYAGGQALFPVVGVNWEDANAFCGKAGKRLPTEEEWEFAARGTENLLYPWGNDWKPEMANIGSRKFAEVGKFKGASPFGVYDLIGNAGEWTASDFKPYPNGKLSDNYFDKINLKTVRGGSVVTLKESATATYRIGLPPTGIGTYNRTGFRCIQDLEK